VALPPNQIQIESRAVLNRSNAKMTPDVSILMPVYNGMPYVRQAIESVLAQTLPNWQCVIVNDGSRDGTRDYLATLSDRRFVTIDQENAGISAAINRGLEHCTARYIARLDADDIALPTRLAEQVAFLEARPDVALVGTQVVPMGSCGAGSSLKLPTTHEDIMSDLVAARHAVAHSSVMIRADILRQIGGYWDLSFGEEYDLMLRIGEVAKLANLDQVLLQYRVHQSSMNGSAMRRMRTSVLYACESARRRQVGMPPISFEDFQSRRNLRPRWQRAFESIDIHARNQYRYALAELYGGRRVRGAARLVWAAACAPRLTFARILRVARPARREVKVAQGVTG
jgi:glycosyltransferase involved in cell wall biosynthesis